MKKTLFSALLAGVTLLAACAPNPERRVNDALVSGAIPPSVTNACSARAEWGEATVKSRYAGELHATAYSYTRHSLITLPPAVLGKYLGIVDYAYGMPYETSPVAQRAQADDLRRAILSLCLQDHLRS